MRQMEGKDRPRTKRLERPTPNLKHPIVGTKKSKEVISTLEKCIEGIDKCKTDTNNRSHEELSCERKPKNRLCNDDYSQKSDGNFKSPSSPRQTQSQHNNNKEETDISTKNKTAKIVKQETLVKSGSAEETDLCGWQHFNAQLLPCRHCRRTFFPHRLPIHERSCRGIGVQRMSKKLQESKPTVNSSPVMKSLFLDCRTCGRKYSTTSLTLHELKCRADCNRRVTTDQEGLSGNEWGSAWEQFKSQLVACNKCKRKFLADRLERHEPICKASPLKRVDK